MLFMGLGFALIWRIWWLALLCVALIVALIIIRSFDRDTDMTIPAHAVEQVESGARDETSVTMPTAGVRGGTVIAHSILQSGTGGISVSGSTTSTSPSWAPMDR
jgi:cytochrome o ubiquinol oxidase subunit 1